MIKSTLQNQKPPGALCAPGARILRGTTRLRSLRSLLGLHDPTSVSWTRRPDLLCKHFGWRLRGDLNRPNLLDTFQPDKMALDEVKMSSKRYPEEFKIEAVRQVVERGHSVAEVASRLGMTTHSF